MDKWNLSKLPEGRKPLPDEWFAERAQMQDRIKELEKQLRWVLYERDATFKSMLNRAETAEERAEALEELVMDVVADLREGVSASKIDYRIGKVMQKMEWKDE